MTRRAALILAGGTARRFQTQNSIWEDKALAILDGKPLLVQAIEKVRGLVDEVVVCVNDERRKEKYNQTFREHGLKGVCLVVDEKCGISGPTVAIMSGLKAVQAELCLTLPCDMPCLEPEVAEYMFHESEEFDVVTPMWPDGRLETLLNVLRQDNALEITQTLCSLNRPRSDDIQRGAGKLLLISPVGHIRTLDPDFKSFININSKQDLKRLQTRRTHGLVRPSPAAKSGKFGGFRFADASRWHKNA